MKNSFETDEVFAWLNSDENLYLESLKICTKIWRNRTSEQNLKRNAIWLRKWTWEDCPFIWREIKRQDKTAKKRNVDWEYLVKVISDVG